MFVIDVHAFLMRTEAAEEEGAEDDDMDGLQTDGEDEDGDESEKEMGEDGDGDGASNSSFKKMGAQVGLHLIQCFYS